MVVAIAPRGWTPPTRMIIPYGAGNITDVVARVLLDELTGKKGWRTAADNQPGAGGLMGANNLIRATPDGSVFGVVAAAALTILPHVQKPRFDPFPELSAVTGLTISNSFLAVNGQLPVHSLDELVAYARSRPKDQPLFYPSPGIATVPHINLEQLCHTLDFPMQHVPYRTSAAGNADLLAGRVQVTMDSFSLTMTHMQRGTLRPLAFNGPARHPLLPQIPTFTEIAPQVELTNSWQGLFFPKGLPPAVLARATEDLLDVVNSADFAAKLPPGATPMPLPPDQLAARVTDESQRIGRLVAAIGLSLD
jgi:tripartite-type tricarboxylate transporter receptor subunit TctC